MSAGFLPFHDMISWSVRRHMMPWIEDVPERETGVRVTTFAWLGSRPKASQ